MRRLWRDRRGATAIEYGLIAALITVVIVLSVRATGNTTGQLYDSFNTGLANATR